MRRTVACLLFPILLSSAHADDIDRKADALYGRFMPPCCYTGLLRDHHSAAADTMKQEILGFLKEGKSEEEIADHYVRRYGERILAVPALRGFNRLAVLAPILALAGGALFVSDRIRRRRRKAGGAPSTAEPAGIDSGMNERIEREIREGH
jgi:cytochrome c-type biogenesis protein CcmH/NrfF